MSALVVQLFYTALCVLWNAVGLWQASNGLPTIGPTASSTAIVILLSLSTLLLLSVFRGWGLIYFVVSLFLLVGAVSAIYGGFTKDVSLWPSEFWRYAGIAVNSVGVAAFAMALLGLVNSRAREQSMGQVQIQEK